VIDVEKGIVLLDRTVKIAKGVFVSIEKSKNVDMQEDGWVSVDARGLYMCPGLIDCESSQHLKALETNAG
jgi:N-acyl-D-aspartate/D-glutamate deacylase